MLATRYIRGFSLGPIENFNHPLVQKVIRMFQQAPMPVWLDHAGQMTCVHPNKEIYKILIEGDAAPDEVTKAEAEVWREIYEPLWTQAKI